MLNRTQISLYLGIACLLIAPSSISTETNDLEEITVYGTTNPQTVFDYPGTVTVLDKNEIELSSPSAISDIFTDIPGVEFSRGPRRTGEIPSIRGLGGDNVLILVDGARQSFSSAHDGRFFIDPDILKKVEVVKGPSSGLYGSGTMGGVFAFETATALDLLDANESKGGRLKFGNQSVNDEFLGSISTYGLIGSFDLLANVAFRQSGDIELGSGDELSSDDEIENYLLKGGLSYSDWRIESSWQKFNNNAIEPNNGQRAATDADVNKDIDNDSFKLGIDFLPNSNFINSQLTVYHNITEVEEFDSSTTATTSQEVKSTGVSIKNVSNLTLGNLDVSSTFGGNWYKDKQKGKNDSSGDGTLDGVPDASAEFYGFFAQAEINLNLSEKINALFIPGVRYDHFKTKANGEDNNSDKAWSPRFALSVGSDLARIFTSYSEAFRAPSMNELFLDGIHFGLPHPILGAGTTVNNNFVSNPNLKPEKSDTIEAGLSLNFSDLIFENDSLSFKAAYYETDVKDLIDISVNIDFSATCFAPPFFSPCNAGTTESSNITDAEISGLELEAIFDSEYFRLSGSYTTIDGLDKTTGADVGTLTPNRLNIDSRLKLADLGAVVGLKLGMAKDFDGIEFSTTTNSFNVNDRRSGYVLLDFYTSWSPRMLEGIRFDLAIDNVFDKNYERIFQGVSEPGINVKTTLSYEKSF